MNVVILILYKTRVVKQNSLSAILCGRDTYDSLAFIENSYEFFKVIKELKNQIKLTQTKNQRYFKYLLKIKTITNKIYTKQFQYFFKNLYIGSLQI